MSTTNQVAARVAEEIRPQSDRLGFDFITIIAMIIEILNNIFPILQDFCPRKEPEDVVSMARNPSWLQRLWLRRRVRRTLGAKLYREIGGDVVDGLLRVARGLSAGEVARIYDECDDCDGC